MDNKDIILAKLQDIEDDLKKLNLWGGLKNRPKEEAFLSHEPFCLDTMEFHQWLEYVLIDKFKYLIENNLDLPSNLLLHTIAEEYYRGEWRKYRSLIHTLRELDKCFN